MDLLALDIGNSRIGWMLLVDDAPAAQGHAPEARSCAEALSACGRLDDRRRSGLLVAGACVKPAALEERLAPLLQPLGKRVHLIGRDLPAVLPTRVREPEKTGTDRLASALAASVRIGRPAIIVNAGTAVTVDLVDADGYFCGGAILPGLRTQLWSLHARTAQLPEVAVTAPPETAIGRDTTEAVRAGVYFGLVGAVEELVRRARAAAGAVAPVIAAGGDAELLARASPCLKTVDEYLVCRGVFEWVRRAIAKGWRPPEP
jgi:type III pantothenate kinase